MPVFCSMLVVWVGVCMSVAEAAGTGCGELAWATRTSWALLVQTGRTELVSWNKVME